MYVVFVMSSQEENLECTYPTSSDEDNLDWDSQTSLKSLSPGSVACSSRASGLRGPRLLTRQEIPGGGPVFWGDASGRSGIGYEKCVVHDNTTPEIRKPTEGPVARPAAEFPTVPPKDGIVTRSRKTSKNAPTRPREPRFWELRSDCKRQEAKYV